jgi:hypothetical protein
MNFPYAMPAEQRPKFLATVRALKAGDSHALVIRVLGTPYSDDPISAKERYDAPIVGTYTTYYLKKERGDNVNEKLDEYINLTFDEGGKLVRKSTNVVGLPLWDGTASSSPVGRECEPRAHHGPVDAAGR